jgi:hypothetical protein
MSKTHETSPLVDYFDALADRLSSEPPASTVTINSVRVLKPRESKPTTSSKTGSFGQTIDGLRIGVTITKCRWPDPRRVVRVVVGELTAYSGTWDADSRAKAEAVLAAILCDQPEALAYLTRALEEVQL